MRAGIRAGLEHYHISYEQEYQFNIINRYQIQCKHLPRIEQKKNAKQAIKARHIKLVTGTKSHKA